MFPASPHYFFGILKYWKTKAWGQTISFSENTAHETVRAILGFFLEHTRTFKSPAVPFPLFLTKLFVLFADNKHFSLFLLSLTNDSLFVLQGRWWKKSVLATSSVVIILFLLSPTPDCKAIHWLFLVTEALPPWLCLQHSICLSLLCPLMCTLLLAYPCSVVITFAEKWRQSLTFPEQLLARC